MVNDIKKTVFMVIIKKTFDYPQKITYKMHAENIRTIKSITAREK